MCLLVDFYLYMCVYTGDVYANKFLPVGACVYICMFYMHTSENVHFSMHPVYSTLEGPSNSDLIIGAMHTPSNP